MIRVLIAEDEMPLLRGMKRLIESLHTDFQVVKCASNGKEAIEYLEENSVDVIFTDINMPLIDGLEVLSIVHAKYPEVYRVVLSGYNDFEYARHAIHAGVSEYLLKPIARQELLDILNILSDKVKNKRLQKQDKCVREAVYQNRPFASDKKIHIAYLCIGPMLPEHREELITEFDLWHKLKLEQTIARFLPEGVTVYVLEKQQVNERILLTVSDTEIVLGHALEQFMDSCGTEDLPISSAYIDRACSSEDIPQVLIRLRNLLAMRILVYQSSLIEADHDGGEVSDSADTLLSLVDREPSAEQVKIVLQALGDRMRNMGITQYVCIEVLEHLLKSVTPDDEHVAVPEIVWELMVYSANSDELLTSVEKVLQENIEQQEPDSTHEMMVKIEQFIMEHLAQPITVTSIAQDFNLVAPYISRLFKEYSSYTIAQYIQKNRLDRAKWLLELEGEILIKDVAEMVGYPNPLHFSKVFKKKIGVYPSEYREAYGKASSDTSCD